MEGGGSASSFLVLNTSAQGWERDVEEFVSWDVDNHALQDILITEERSDSCTEEGFNLGRYSLYPHSTMIKGPALKTSLVFVQLHIKLEPNSG
jgi:hypothetical protein